MARRFIVPDLPESGDLASNFDDLGLFVFNRRHERDINLPTESTEVRIPPYVVPQEESAISPGSGSFVGQVGLQEETQEQEKTRVTVSCDCRNTCQRKGCPCKNSGQYCSNECTCRGSKRKPCQNRLVERELAHAEGETETSTRPAIPAVTGIDVKVMNNLVSELEKSYLFAYIIYTFQINYLEISPCLYC